MRLLKSSSLERGIGYDGKEACSLKLLNFDRIGGPLTQGQVGVDDIMVDDVWPHYANALSIFTFTR